MGVKRWKVQGFLTDYSTHCGDKPYGATYHRWRWQALRQANAIRLSHGPGMVRVKVSEVESLCTRRKQ
jgi:hypothetical protein